MQKMLIISPQSCKKSDNLRAKKSTLKKFTYMYFCKVYFCKVYFCKVYFPKVYPTCVSSMLCEFIEYEHVKSPKFHTFPIFWHPSLRISFSLILRYSFQKLFQGIIFQDIHISDYPPANFDQNPIFEFPLTDGHLHPILQS